MLDNLKEFIEKRRNSQKEAEQKKTDEKLAARLEQVLPKKSHETGKNSAASSSRSESDSGDLH